LAYFRTSSQQKFFREGIKLHVARIIRAFTVIATTVPDKIAHTLRNLLKTFVRHDCEGETGSLATSPVN
jgi:hypothetical protein